MSEITNRQEEEETINIRELLEKYMYHWKWFVLGVLVFGMSAFLYLRYTQPNYSATATLLIEEDTKGSVPSEMAIFEDLGVFGSSSSLENEIEVLKSRRILGSVIDELDLLKEYLSIGCLLYTSPSPRDATLSRMPSSA